MRIIWKDVANFCLTRIQLYLKKNKVDRETVKEILNKIGSAPQKLLQFPRMGQLTDIVEGEEVRHILIKGYKIYYKVEDDTIFILSVLHSKEDIEGIEIKSHEEKEEEEETREVHYE